MESASILASLCTEKPPAPTNAPEILAIGPRFVELSWQPPEHDGGSPITGYYLERADLAGRTWLPINKTPVKTTKHKIENLYEELKYEIRVRAENKEGIGEPSPATEPFYCKEAIGQWNIQRQSST